MYVTKEISVRLKAIGFDEDVRHHYVDSSDCIYDELHPLDHWNQEDGCYSAPTLDEAANWLRNVKGLHVLVVTNKDHDGWIAGIQQKGTYEPIEVISEENPSNTHDLALSAAITHAIEIAEKEVKGV